MELLCGNRTQEGKDGDSGRIYNTYNEEGLLLNSQSGGKINETHDYDLAGREIFSQDQFSFEDRIREYDDKGDLVSQDTYEDLGQGPGFRRSHVDFEYDEVGNLTKTDVDSFTNDIEHGENIHNHYKKVYDTIGDSDKVIDEEGTSSYFESGSSHMDYDVNGNLLKATDAGAYKEIRNIKEHPEQFTDGEKRIRELEAKSSKRFIYNDKGQIIERIILAKVRMKNRKILLC